MINRERALNLLLDEQATVIARLEAENDRLRDMLKAFVVNGDYETR